MMMDGGSMGMGWGWMALFFLYVIPMALTVWALILMSGIRRELQGIREAVRDIADRIGKG